CRRGRRLREDHGHNHGEDVRGSVSAIRAGIRRGQNFRSRRKPFRSFTLGKGMNVLSALAIASAIAARQPAALTVQSLGRPATARNILAGLITTNPRDGKEVLILSNNNEFTGAELIFIDLESRNATVVTTPAGAGIETLLEVSGNLLVLGTFYDGTLM